MRSLAPIVGLLAGALLAGCGGGPAGPSAAHPALIQVATSPHYIVRAAPGDGIDVDWQEQYYTWLTAVLELGPSPPLEYHKYRNRAHIEALTGQAANGFAEAGTVRFHSIWPIDNHEGVHTLVILQIGHPPALFNEGVAVAHQTNPATGRLTPRWNGTDLHVLARQYDAGGRLPALGSLLATRDFFKLDANVTYPCAGSFVRYLIDTYGLPRFKTLLAGARFEDPPTTTEARFQSVYGRSLSVAWTEWRHWIQQYQPPAD